MKLNDLREEVDIELNLMQDTVYELLAIFANLDTLSITAMASS